MSDFEQTALAEENVEVFASGTSKFKIEAIYQSTISFCIDIPLGDKTIVKSWWIRYGNLYVDFVNGERKIYNGVIEYNDYKYSESIEIRDLDEDEYEYIIEGEIIEV